MHSCTLPIYLLVTAILSHTNVSTINKDKINWIVFIQSKKWRKEKWFGFSSQLLLLWNKFLVYKHCHHQFAGCIITMEANFCSYKWVVILCNFTPKKNLHTCIFLRILLFCLSWSSDPLQRGATDWHSLKLTPISWMHKRKPPPWREGQDWSCHFHRSQLRNVSQNVLHHLPWLCTWERQKLAYFLCTKFAPAFMLNAERICIC